MPDPIMNTRADISASPHRQDGFSLVELVIVLAVAAVLASFAAPSFTSLSSGLQQTREFNVFAADLRLARLEAIKRGNNVTICARNTATDCGTDWSQGWHVFAEADALSPGQVAAGDTLLRSHTIRESARLDIAAQAIVRPAAMAARNYLSFDSRGRADWTVGTWVLCDSRKAPEALALVVNGAGGSRKAIEEGSGADVVSDAVGDPVTCPS